MLPEKPWKPEAVLRYLVALFTSILIGVILAGWFSSSISPFTLDLRFTTVLIGALSFHGMALILTSSLLKQHQLSWSEAFGFRAPKLGRAMLLALIVGVAVLPIAWSLARVSAKLMARFHLEPVVQETVQTLQTADALELRILLGVLAVLVAPVAEELVFRGILYPAIKQSGFPRLALWGTSLLFAAIHNNAMIFLSLTLLAVILTLLYETTHNLLAPILTHSLFNLANFFWVVTRSAPPGS